MVCIYCRATTRVTNSRPQIRSNAIWRRRQCQKCQAIFTTQERPDLSASLAFFQPKTGLVPFSRQTLFLSLYNSLRHRQNAQEDAESLTDTIVGALLRTNSQAAVERDQLVSLAQQTLQRFDTAAAVSYNAFHPLPTKTASS